jgi:hypothetical protein
MTQDELDTAVCNVCKQPISGEKLSVRCQKIEDEDGNEIKDAPWIWFHKSCLGKPN